MKDAPRNCADCNRPMRGSKHTLEARPGTVKHEGRGLCTACYRRHAVDGTLPEPIRNRRTAADRTNLTPCQGKDCQRMLRPLGARLEDYPGSFGVKAKGLCSACYDPCLTEERAHARRHRPHRKGAGQLRRLATSVPGQGRGAAVIALCIAALVALGLAIKPALDHDRTTP